MKTTRSQVTHQIIIALTLLTSIGCTPITALSDCDHEHHKNEIVIPLPDFGFNFSGACGSPPPETAPADKDEQEDELLKDIEKPLEEPSSDLAVALEEKQQTS
jgi:hypothetical protein